MQQAVEVGDRAGHVLVLTQAGVHVDDAHRDGGREVEDVHGRDRERPGRREVQDRGYVVVTMENGDKAFVHVARDVDARRKDGAPISDDGTWSYAGGTGKLKGLKGKGT